MPVAGKSDLLQVDLLLKNLSSQELQVGLRHVPYCLARRQQAVAIPAYDSRVPGISSDRRTARERHGVLLGPRRKRTFGLALERPSQPFYRIEIRRGLQECPCGVDASHSPAALAMKLPEYSCRGPTAPYPMASMVRRVRSLR
eukprot:scaffold6702_cov390-Prasinococcus_capsulatus_cf.AAC.8